jgi:hypothetical protein
LHLAPLSGFFLRIESIAAQCIRILPGIMTVATDV